MKLQPFVRPRWDAYDAFHIRPAPTMVQFDTGEVICLEPRPNIDFRNHKFPNNVEFFHTGQDPVGNKRFVIPGDKQHIPSSWFNRSSPQYLLIDHDTKHVVGLRQGYGKFEQLNIPKRLRAHARAYFPGEDCPPMGMSILLGRPWVFTSEERAEITAKEAACEAWAAIHAHDKRPSASAEQLTTMQLLKTPLADLTNPQRWSIARAGVKPTYTDESYPHLLLELV